MTTLPFLSTLSLRRATICVIELIQRGFVFLSTLSLRRATRGAANCYLDNIISIHALLAESDEPTTGRNDKDNIFLSTLSLRRATSLRHSAPRWRVYFYPRSPCGERRLLCYTILACLYFYPRSPCGERQRLGLLGWLRTLISIHALLAESDAP